MRGNGALNRRAAAIVVAAAMAFQSACAAEELSSLAAQVVSSPDLSVGGSYEVSTKAEVLDAMLDAPVLLARLWAAYGFSPRYAARPVEGDGLHVDDPTGIAGDLYPAGFADGRRVFVARGAIAHRLVPAFKGSAVLIISESREGDLVALRVDLYLRMDSRVVGFFMKPFAPYLRSLVLRRLGANIADLGAILGDLSAEPAETAARLGPEDSAAILASLAKR